MLIWALPALPISIALYLVSIFWVAVFETFENASDPVKSHLVSDVSVPTTFGRLFLLEVWTADHLSTNCPLFRAVSGSLGSQPRLGLF
jgi:hypothetical protein